MDFGWFRIDFEGFWMAFWMDFGWWIDFGQMIEWMVDRFWIDDWMDVGQIFIDFGCIWMDFDGFLDGF